MTLPDPHSCDATAAIVDRLRQAGLRPTRQRVALGQLLLGGVHRHLTAESLYEEAEQAGAKLSLATIYNTLNQFTAAGLLRQVVVDADRAYFDTNVSDHHHFFREDRGVLIDIASGDLTVSGLPAAPAGSKIARVDVVIRLEKA